MALKGAKFGHSIDAELSRYLGVPKWILSVKWLLWPSFPNSAMLWGKDVVDVLIKKTATFEINFVHYAK